jgi:transcriptional regulator with XRE-family HTH domain
VGSIVQAEGLEDWVRAVRERSGMSQIAFAQTLGVKQPTVSRWERGIDRPAPDALARIGEIAAAFDLPPPPAAFAGLQPRPALVPVVGYVGAGAEVIPFDEYAPGEGMEQVEAPSAAQGAVVAVRVRGESMFPIEDGWLVFYRRDHDGVPSFCNQRLCIVKVAEGPTLLKKLRFAPDGYYLESWNAPTRFAPALDWAAPIIDIRPRL